MKKIIILGATSGIGKELAKIYVQHNYKVGITGRRKELLEELKAENPELFFSKVIDITQTDSLPFLLDELVLELGGLDIFILCSDTGDLNNELDFDIEKRTIDTNVTGFTCTADWAFNYFEKQKTGHFAAISSVGGIRGSRQCPSYNASKAYQITYLEALRQKAKKTGFPIFVTDIRPGFVNTDMAKGEGLFWITPVQKAAQQIFKAINTKKRIEYVSKRWGLIAWFLKILPGRLYEKL